MHREESLQFFLIKRFIQIMAVVGIVEYIVTFLLNLLFYGSPVVYQLSMFGSDSLLVKLIRLNPITQFLECYRNCFLYQVPPSFSTMLTLLAIALISVIVGYTVFRRLEKGFAEEL